MTLPVSGRGPIVATGSARSLLLTILGELVYPHGGPVWTSSLLHVMTGLGVEVQTARQTLARSAAAGWLIGEKHGREMRWKLSSDVKRLIEDGMRRVYSLDRRSEPWDRNWLILLVTVPNSHRDARKRLYKALEWSGFGNPTPGVWLNPCLEQEPDVRRIIRDLELVVWTLGFCGSARSVGLSEEQIVQRGWVISTRSKRCTGNCSSDTLPFDRWKMTSSCSVSSSW